MLKRGIYLKLTRVGVVPSKKSLDAERHAHFVIIVNNETYYKKKVAWFPRGVSLRKPWIRTYEHIYVFQNFSGITIAAACRSNPKLSIRIDWPRLSHRCNLPRNQPMELGHQGIGKKRKKNVC